MHDDEIDLISRLAEELCDGSENEGVANAMESVFAQPVFLRNLLVNGIRSDMQWEATVERRVEMRNVSHVG